ncbi:hypothetical protein [Cyanobium sp. NIES-981]|uniref:hypothetical protein n=1 Tax=Cyanobium sp. NIES-981 TaxID=1851505 RepID=UPI000B352EE7|nr:hypothetical protein [Cyanobium sp. NIES-981]
MKSLAQQAVKQAYTTQVMQLYSVLSSKLLTARGGAEQLEASRQFQNGLALARDTLLTATRNL